MKGIDHVFFSWLQILCRFYAHQDVSLTQQIIGNSFKDVKKSKDLREDGEPRLKDFQRQPC
jgi:hypothetical protein